MIRIRKSRYWTLDKRITLYTLIAVGASLLLGFYFMFHGSYQQHKRHFVYYYLSQLRMTAEYCIAPIELGQPEAAKEFIEKIAALKAVKCVWLEAPDGTLWISAPAGCDFPGNLSGDSLSWTEEYLHIRTEIRGIHGELLGYLRAGVSTEELRTFKEEQFWNSAILFISCLLLCGLPLSAFLRSRLIQPIVQLERSLYAAVQNRTYRIVDAPPRSSKEVRWLYRRVAYILSTIRRQLKELHQKQLDLERQEGLYKALFDNDLIGVLLVDLSNNKIVQSSPKAQEILNLKDNACHFAGFFAQRTVYESFVEELQSKGRVAPQEALLRVQQHKNLWGLIAAKKAGNNMAEVVVQDISDMKHNMNELQRLSDELDNFVYHASHELRAPLRSILGIVQLMEFNPSADNVQQCVGHLKRSIERLDETIQLVVAVSETQAHNNEAEPIDVETLIRQSIEHYDYLNQDQRVDIRYEVRFDTEVMIDKFSLSLIINNLLSNALKYADYAKPHPMVRIVAEVQDSNLILSIEDNGVGIPLKIQPHIFKMFYRGHERSEGAGLGLYIVKKVVSRLGGRILFVSEPGKSTTFYVRLPLAQAPFHEYESAAAQ
ncbi:sensor histidine kinase [Thermonema rossianum]|uniref:sensor histidine kinase n=1 Tax=Thermonema rossianum TaxID=55505 RepID=UPI00056F4E61|nr:HAMP domain-containing sensor histidine kinase [Thermonema rossianum]